MNPVDMHTLVADLTDPGYALHATTPAISFALADADGWTNNVNDSQVWLNLPGQEMIVSVKNTPPLPMKPQARNSRLRMIFPHPSRCGDTEE